MERGHLEAPRVECAWILPWASLPRADFQLYPVPVVNRSRE